MLVENSEVTEEMKVNCHQHDDRRLSQYERTKTLQSSAYSFSLHVALHRAHFADVVFLTPNPLYNLSNQILKQLVCLLHSRRCFIATTQVFRFSFIVQSFQ